jgi:hypothetical protein
MIQGTFFAWQAVDSRDKTASGTRKGRVVMTIHAAQARRFPGAEMGGYLPEIATF